MRIGVVQRGKLRYWSTYNLEPLPTSFVRPKAITLFGISHNYRLAMLSTVVVLVQLAFLTRISHPPLGTTPILSRSKALFEQCRPRVILVHLALLALLDFPLFALVNAVLGSLQIGGDPSDSLDRFALLLWTLKESWHVVGFEALGYTPNLRYLV